MFDLDKFDLNKFDLEQFYEQVQAGNEIDVTEVCQYINSFEDVIIWGAGNLGTALGKYFLENGIRLSGYWDQKYREIKERNGVHVYESFGEMPDHEKDRTLIVCGIVNGTHSHTGQYEQLKKLGYSHCILGMILYEGIVCRMRKGGQLDVRQCTGTSICNFNTCRKYLNILDQSSADTAYKNLIHVLEFVISRKCTLDCVECGQRVGRIKREFPEKYVVYPLQRVLQDIDVIMDHVDAVGTFSIIGGEPFTHPQLAEIVRHSLSKPNVAIISITTNGICHMTKEMLMRMKSDRVKINFSNYTGSLPKQQKELFEQNVRLVKECGLNCNVATPEWGRVHDTVAVNPQIDEGHYKKVKSSCPFGPSVSNGVLYACPVTELYDKLEEVDVSSDQVRLTEGQDFRKAIHELLSKPYYETCRHRCGAMLPQEKIPCGVQAKDFE